MNTGIRVAAPPDRPLMVYDGDCHFCGLWIGRARQLTGEAVDYLPAQNPSVAEQFPEIPRERFAEAVQLIVPNGMVYSGAEAVFRALAFNQFWRWPNVLYHSVPLFAGLTDWGYRFVAQHRPWFSIATRWLWGQHVELPNYSLARWLFLRALGGIYLIAFISLWSQVHGLIGHGGILPTDELMKDLRDQCMAQGIGGDRFLMFPTLCWFDATDSFLVFQCAAGSLIAVFLIVGLAPVPCLSLLWLLYLSLATVGRDFLSFQWDSLLLEAGFLAIFIAPLRMWPRWQRETGDAMANAPPSRLAVWLLRLLLFKLMFMSGCVKLLSGDPLWHQLTALTQHYQTQPLPTWIAWYAQQLPVWFQKCSCAMVLAIEIGAPFLIFTPRRPRIFGAAALVFLQILILLTGNYTFFNWLTLALCLLLLDDFALSILIPKFVRPWFPHSEPSLAANWKYFGRLAIVLVIAALWVSLSGDILWGTLRPHSRLLEPVARLADGLAPFRTVNGYGLFAVMTTPRKEIIVEGSDDQIHWRPYEFKYKPGEVGEQPVFVAPFQPRLDWQMWFAALGSPEQNPWFGNFCLRLLQGSPDVLALLAQNPFPEHPPRWIRAEFYEYEFTDFAERRVTGAWWKRKFVGEYLPPMSLR